VSRPRRRLATTFLAMVVSACATTRLQAPEPSLPLSRLPGWAAEDHAAAFAVVRQTCVVASPPSRPRLCDDALAADPQDDAAARAFLETHLRANPVDGGGLLTAYFSPSYEARSAPDGDFTSPVRPAPAAQTTADRAAIDASPAPDALAWMRAEDLFFLQIQGSGVLTFADGTRRRAAFAGSNETPFVAVAGPMVRQGLLAPGAASASAIHAWLVAHHGPAAQAIMNLDPRYIFFRLVPDDGGEPAGASGVALIPGRSLAIDPAYHPYFELLWIDAHGGLAGARAHYQRLAVALDRGGAITGPVRADLYTGSGPAAGDEAATVRHRLTLYRLVSAS
jgi:membrane-bound lytic murein transglycosylase A